MNNQDLLFAINLPPEKAIEYFKAKGYTISWNWRDTWQEAHAKAFTVAKVLKLDILQDIREEINKALVKGITFEQFYKELMLTLKNNGWWGYTRADQTPGYNPESGIDPSQMVMLGSPRRLKTIYQANMETAYMAGRYKGMLDLVQFRPYWQYIQIQRKTKRHDHSLLHEKVFMWNDPIWKVAYPPNGFHCGCRVITLTEAEVKEKGLKVYTFKDVEGFQADEGWNYNPGEASFTIDEAKYYKELLAQFKIPSPSGRG